MTAAPFNLARHAPPARTSCPALRITGPIDARDAGGGGGDVARRWHNPLPSWIEQSATFAALTPSTRLVLQSIADLADRPAHRGASLTGAIGGTRLVERAGLSRRTVDRCITRLLRLGFIALLERGENRPGRNPTANVYGVPARHGALSAKDQGRRGQMMVRGSDGVYRPHRLPCAAERPAERMPTDQDADPNQLLLWEAPDRLTGGGWGKHPCVRMTLPPCQDGTPPSPSIGRKTRLGAPARLNGEGGSNGERSGVSIDRVGEGRGSAPATPQEMQRGAIPGVPGREAIPVRDSAGRQTRTPTERGGCGRALGDARCAPATGPVTKRAGRRAAALSRPPTFANVRPDDLTSTPRLLELFADAARRGFVRRDSERDRLNFTAAAHHAVRVGAKPAALFAHLVRRRKWLFITEADEQAAWQRLKRHDLASGLGARAPGLGARAPGHREQEAQRPEPATRIPKPAFSSLSPDARAVAAIITAAKQRGLSAHDPRTLLRLSTQEPWPPERFERADDELRAWRATG